MTNGDSLGGGGDVPQSHATRSEGPREHKPPHLVPYRRVLVLYLEHSDYVMVLLKTGACCHLGDLVGGDDEGGEEVEDSVHKEGEEDVEESSAVDVGCQVHLGL